MNLIQTLNEWGINISHDDYIPEHLLALHKSHCFYIDILPYDVNMTNARKFDECNEFFQKVKYKRLFELITKLWLYDDIVWYSELATDKQTIKTIFRKFPLRKCLLNGVLSSKDSISELSQLKFLMELSRRNYIDLALLCKNNGIIIIPMWSCYFVFLKDTAHIHQFEHLVNVEGLYLRQPSVD